MNARTPGRSAAASCATITSTPGPCSSGLRPRRPHAITATGTAIVPESRIARNSPVARPPATSCSRSSARSIAGLIGASSRAPSTPSSSASAAANSASISSGEMPCEPSRTFSSNDSSSCENSATAV
jgi:hypothetical protein